MFDPTLANLHAPVVGRNTYRRRIVLGVAGAIGILALALVLKTSVASDALPLATDALPASAVAGAPNGPVLSERERLDRDIDLYQSAAKHDPGSAYLQTQLGARYLQRARVTGSVGDVLRAERVARTSLSHRTQGNGAGFAVLVAALLEQHRFEDAGQAARQLVAGAPDVYDYQAMLGEVELELGNYDAAGQAFATVTSRRESLAIAPRLARWAEIRGDTTRARTILYHVAAAAKTDALLPSEQRGWFEMRVGDYELRNGNLPAADSALQRGLAVSPQDYRLLGAMARLRAVQHDWNGVILFGDSAIATVLDPATVGLVGDAYRALGDSVKAEEYFRTMEVSVRSQPGAFHRAWSLFLLDHNRRIVQVYNNLRTELKHRRDIYGHDLLGWALYKRGRYEEARVEMNAAMAMGTQDAAVFYHAGMVERAAGNNSRASVLLNRALAVNPHFDAFHPATARATLDTLSGAN